MAHSFHETETNISFNRKIKVSVIIPIYNTEDYLRECLDCVEQQTLKDIEVVLIDDGSTDGSLDICNEYAQKDDRFFVYHQQNTGAGAARNKGLEFAKGDYISFWDSDDFFEPDMLEKLYLKATAAQTDITFCDFVLFDEETKQDLVCEWSIQRKHLPARTIFSLDDCPDTILNILSNDVWNQFYKRSFIQNNHLFFQNLQNSNDVYFSATALCLAKKITFLDRALIHHRKRSNSLTATREKDWKASTKAILALEKFLKEHNLFEKIKRSFIPYSFGTISVCYTLKEPYLSIWLDFFRSKVATHFGYFSENKHYLRKSQIKFLNELEKKKNLTPLLEDFHTKKPGKIVPIVLSSCTNSEEYLSVGLIQSIIAHANNECFYDIYVLFSAKESLLKEKLEAFTNKNVRITYLSIDAERLAQNLGISEIEADFSALLIPELFCGYEKVLYLNPNAIVQKDLAEIFKTDIGQNAIAGVVDVEDSTYVEKKIGLISERFISSSLLIFNIPVWNESNILDSFCETFKSLGQNFSNPFRDILNIVCCNSISYLKKSYCGDICSILNPQDIEYSLEKLNIEDFYILDYKKNNPFLKPEEELSDIWWSYVRGTPLYEQILSACFSYKSEQKKDDAEHNFTEADIIGCPKKIRFKQKMNLQNTQKDRGILKLFLLFSFNCTLYCLSFGKTRLKIREKVDSIHKELYEKLQKKLYENTNM